MSSISEIFNKKPKFVEFDPKNLKNLYSYSDDFYAKTILDQYVWQRKNITGMTTHPIDLIPLKLPNCVVISLNDILIDLKKYGDDDFTINFKLKDCLQYYGLNTDTTRNEFSKFIIDNICKFNVKILKVKYDKEIFKKEIIKQLEFSNKENLFFYLMSDSIFSSFSIYKSYIKITAFAKNIVCDIKFHIETYEDKIKRINMDSKYWDRYKTNYINWDTYENHLY